MTAPGRYCLAVCYCGGCPQYAAQRLEPVTETIVDARHVASGKRRARSLAQFRAAQAAVAQAAAPGSPALEFGWPRCTVCGGAIWPGLPAAGILDHPNCAGVPRTAANLRAGVVGNV